MISQTRAKEILSLQTMWGKFPTSYVPNNVYKPTYKTHERGITEIEHKELSRILMSWDALPGSASIHTVICLLAKGKVPEAVQQAALAA